VRLALTTVIVVALAGCGEPRSSYGARTERLAKRAAAAQAHVTKDPVVTTHKVGTGELLVVDVPVADDGGYILEVQKCFVWRDAAFRSVTMTCPSRDIVIPSN
jgi:hypothetical protein